MGIDLTGKQIKLTYDGLLKSTDNLAITSEKRITDGLGNDLPLKLSPTTIKFPGVMNFSETTSYVSAPWALPSDITNLQNQIDTNAADISTNTTNISTNATDIANLQGGVGNVIDVNGETGSLIMAAGTHLDLDINSITNTFTYDLKDSVYNTITGNTNTSVVALGVAQSALTLANTNASDIAELNNGFNNVNSLNGLFSDLTITGGTGISITDNGTNLITITATGGGTGAVDDVNGITGSVNIVSTDTDFLTITENGQDIELEVLAQRTILEDVKNVTTFNLQKGTAVHITGSTGNEAEIIRADASLGLPAHLVLNEYIPANGGTGKAVAVGFINNVPIPSGIENFQPGTEVYLGNNGTFTHIKPTGTSIVQYLGVVIKASATSGSGNISGVIQNLGVENQLPNLAQNKIWLGDSNGVPQQVDFAPFTATTAVDSLETLTGDLTFSGTNISISTIGTDVIHLSASTGTETTINNNADNRIITGSDTPDTLNGETNLTYNGLVLSVNGDVDASGDLFGDAVNIKNVFISGNTIPPLASGDFPYIGDISPVAGSSLTAGEIYYLSSSGWVVTSSSGETTSSGHLGLAVSTTEVMIRGYARNTNYAGYTTGDILYLKDSAGDITNVQPLTTGHIVRNIGYVINGASRVIYFNPSNDYFEVE